MTIIQEAPNLFYIGESPEAKTAHIDYRLSGNLLTILHTEVAPVHRGQGVGQQLVAYAVDYVRKNNLKITSLCSYAHKQLADKPEYSDVFAG
jgi:uncharacterized protein